MSGFRNVMKDGWHPKGKEGGKESWRGDFKGINQVAGWMGKGRDADSADKSEHVSQPMSSLKDPSSFGPPPKHINYHGAAAVPNQTTPDRRGLGAPLSQDQINNQHTHYHQEAAEEEEPQKPAPPPVPYRANTTGLSTDHLPPPPRRTDSASPASTNSFSKPKPPKPPPRLPARNGSPSNDPPPVYSAEPVVSHDYINQDASSRLANAGVSVPGFGIGEQGQQSPAHAPVNELQSRFSQMNTGSGSPAPPPPARTPTTESQPGSSGSSIQNFRERHGDKIDAGKQKYGDFRERHADSIDSGKQKYGDFRERHADTIDSGKQKVGDFRERHADSIDAGKNKLSGYKSRLTGAPAPPPPARASTTPGETTRSTSSVQDFRDRHSDKIDSGKQKYGDFRERHADTIDSGKQKYGDFRERHADSIDAGKNKLSGYKSRLTGSPAPPPPARPESSTSSMNLEPAEPARGSSSVQDFRERHADKIEMGKEKWGGVTSRFNTFVDDRKFSNDANKRIPRPPARPSSGAAAHSSGDDLQSQAQRKKAPPPPPKRAEIRAPTVDASSPAPPPIPHGTKPR
ncbi:hypothetical protein N7541_002881 [Penicillium brevicompactum]|uniref:Uncharacterized protein n=1 Tax=Penicillium brevicompactum TaxID=5074 RepID=A0A9W9UYE4_PENBR|nr:hypothetical protein N7541_002881 [Penicillium brevicompactum]